MQYFLIFRTLNIYALFFESRIKIRKQQKILPRDAAKKVFIKERKKQT